MKLSKKRESSIALSIITVTYNSKSDLEQTILSVASQDRTSIEYIIIDGASSDGSLNLIQKYSDIVDLCLSEPDDGIYCAMNKGVLHSNGKYIYFLNAGDTFCSNDVLKRIQSTLREEESEFLLFPVWVEFKGKKRLQSVPPIQKIWKGSFCHQGALIKASFHKKNLYNISYKISADFQLAYQAYFSRTSFRVYKEPLSIMTAGGVSDRQRLRSLFEKFQIVTKYNKNFEVIIFYTYSLLDALVRKCIKIVLPKSVVDRIILSKYELE